MIKKDKRFLHQHELTIMNLVWERGELTDSQVQAEMATAAGLDAAAVTTLVRDLVQNGVLNGREEDRTYVYSPLVSRREVEATLLKDLRDGLFQGSSERLCRSLIDNGIIPKAELLKVAQSL